MGLLHTVRAAYLLAMNATRNPQSPGVLGDAARQRRVELARQAFQDFYAQCFWSYRPDARISEDDIPWLVRKAIRQGLERRIAADVAASEEAHAPRLPSTSPQRGRVNHAAQLASRKLEQRPAESG